MVPPRCVEEKISLLNVSGQAQTTGGVLFVVARNILKALISRCLHLINVCAFEVQMVAEDGQKVQYRPHPIANGLVIGKDLTHTSFYGRFPILGNHRWERAFPLKLAFAIDCVAKSAPLGLLEGNRACST